MTLDRDTLLNNRYRIVEILAQGGMGSVYRAVDENLRINVAVKENLFVSGSYARQFRREAMIMAQLRHPNLPRVTDQFIIEGQGQYLVMDYIKGEDLRQRLERQGVIPEEEVIAIGAAICDALQYLSAHQTPIVHRDIKPGNVKITPQGFIFLVDFGLAKVLEGTQITTTGARAMTPGYSPPEQYGTARTDHRSDIFALGATLYASLTGVIPEDPIARAMDQVELTPICKHDAEVSSDLANVVEKSLKIDPDDRYQTAEVFKQALLDCSEEVQHKKEQYIVSPSPVEVDEKIPGYVDIEDLEVGDEFLEEIVISSRLQPSSDIDKELKPVDVIAGIYGDNRRRGCWIAALVAFVLIVVVGYVLIIYIPNFTSGKTANIWSFALSPSETPAYTIEAGNGTHGSGDVTTPSEERQIYEGTRDSDAASVPLGTPSLSPTGLGVRLSSKSATAAQTSELLKTLTPTKSPPVIPTPLGGGSGQIAFASNRGESVQIHLINIDGTGLRQVTDLTGGACQPSWSPQGERIVFTSPCDANQESYPGAALFIINVDGSGLKPIPTVPGGDFDPAWSPDGTQIAFTSLRDNGRSKILIYDLQENLVASLSDVYSRAKQPAWSPDGKEIIFISERRGVPQIWSMNSDGSNQQLFSKSPGYLNSHPTWSPDGEVILFTQLIASGGIPRLALAPYQFEDYEEYRFTQDQTPMREARYSPDGFWIAFEGWLPDSNQNIFIIASNGASREQVTSDPAVDFDPAWNFSQ